MNQSIPRLLGHSFGDGYIHRAKWYFVYTNKAEELHGEVKESVSNVFGRVFIAGEPQSVGHHKFNSLPSSGRNFTIKVDHKVPR